MIKQIISYALFFGGFVYAYWTQSFWHMIAGLVAILVGLYGIASDKKEVKE